MTRVYMKKTLPPRIIEITLHRSKRNRKLGYVIATLLPCNHHKKLGIALFPKTCKVDVIRVNEVKVITIEEYQITDKEYCYTCPKDYPKWIDKDTKLSTFQDILDVVDIDDD